MSESVSDKVMKQGVMVDPDSYIVKPQWLDPSEITDHDAAIELSKKVFNQLHNTHWLDTSEINKARVATPKPAERIRIKQCSDSMMWYAALIGFEFEVLADEGNVYKTREPAGYINFVLKQDAEVI